MNTIDYIKKLPISAVNKLKIYNFIRRQSWYFRYDKETRIKNRKYQTLIPSNHAYGHEYWLKRYSGYEHAIRGIIEHGVYFGDQKSKIGLELEWDVGNIFPFGASRVGLLKGLYPNYNIIPIGPRIHYVTVDEELLCELNDKIDHAGKTIAVFPAHSITNHQTNFNHSQFILQLFDFINNHNIKNVIICLHPADYNQKLDLHYKDSNFILSGGGSDPIKFLPRLKAIFSCADITYSNALGTHIGYSIYMQKPHVLVTQKINTEDETDEFLKVYHKEVKLFEGAFAPKYAFQITKEQYSICDYYWGFSDIKTAEQLLLIFEQCHKTSR